MEIIAKDERKVIERQICENEQYLKVKGERKHSLYTQCYMQGVKLILNDIVLRVEDKHKEVNNIITFMGGRGTGKTTVLTEFSQLLKDSDEIDLCNFLKQNGIETDQRRFQNKIKFTVLPMIDASLLEIGEDPFLLTLASILAECERHWNIDVNITIYERQEISRTLNEVYRNYLGVQNKGISEEFGESIISKLRSMPSTNKAKTEFDKLLHYFFRTINKGEVVTNFLVVVIDDLDLNIKNGLKMLDQLYKYLSHKQVIVITAVDYKQLSVIAERYFMEDQFKGSQDEIHIKQSKKLALDYLDKFLPVANRIYMPDIIKIGEELAIKVNEEKECELKEYILNKIAEKMHIYYDKVGTKRHFAEQDTVRKMVFYSEFLESLNDVTFSDCKMIKGMCEEEDTKDIVLLQNAKMKQYDENHERFNSDIKERMLYEKTTVEQRELFDALLQRDLGRRARYLIEFKDSWIDDEPLDANIDYKEYSYGEILECIYDWGRESLADKPLLHCIIASFTSEMVREYLNYMYSGKQLSRKHSKERLQQFVGVSFMSSWTNEMLIFEKNEYEWLERNDYSNWELNPVVYESSIFRLENDMTKEKTIENIEIIIEKIIRYIKKEKWIKILECMDMLLSNCRMRDSKSEHVQYSINLMNDWSGRELVMKYSFITEKASFDIGGFIIKSIEPVESQIQFGDEIAEKMTNAIVNYLKEKFDNLALYVESRRDRIKGELVTQSMFYKFDKSKDDIAFPFFDLDISYNVMKRVRKKCIEETQQFKGEILDNILKIYDCMDSELRRQSTNEVQMKYREVFVNHPFIVTVKELQKNYYFERYLYILFNAGIKLQSPEEFVED